LGHNAIKITIFKDQPDEPSIIDMMAAGINCLTLRGLITVTKTIKFRFLVKLINRDVAKRTGDYLDSKVKSGITTAATCNAALSI
jgi:hypothetical protein